ncbi:MAG: ferrous iron transport protein A [Candidatus Thorarchaeota archaeon]
MIFDDTAEGTKVEETVILTDVPSGKTCRLVKVSHHGRQMFRGHRRHKGPDDSERQFRHRNGRILRRLLDLGITTGCVFEVIQGGMNGPVLVQVRGTRVALGHGLASKLLVMVVDE